MELWIYAGAALAVAAALGLILSGRNDQSRRYAHMDFADVRRMNWREFEHFLGDLFRRLGYEATVTQASGDFGVDVLVTAPDGTKIAVQAKHWKSEYVGVQPVLKTVGGAAHYGCQQAIIVTTSGYTDAARQASRTTGVELWGPEEIADLMERARGGRAGARQAALNLVPIAQAAGLPAPRPAGAQPIPLQPPAPTPIVRPVRPAPKQQEPPRCPHCGMPMMARIALERPIWLCPRFPKCRGYAQR